MARNKIQLELVHSDLMSQASSIKLLNNLCFKSEGNSLIWWQHQRLEVLIWISSHTDICFSRTGPKQMRQNAFAFFEMNVMKQSISRQQLPTRWGACSLHNWHSTGKKKHTDNLWFCVCHRNKYISNGMWKASTNQRKWIFNLISSQQTTEYTNQHVISVISHA